jgi:hypothetical protein
MDVLDDEHLARIRAWRGMSAGSGGPLPARGGTSENLTQLMAARFSRIE